MQNGTFFGTSLFSVGTQQRNSLKEMVTMSKVTYFTGLNFFNYIYFICDNSTLTTEPHGEFQRSFDSSRSIRKGKSLKPISFRVTTRVTALAKTNVVKR